MEATAIPVFTELPLHQQAKEALHIAEAYAQDYQHKNISGSHLLKGLLHKNAGLENFLWQHDFDVYFLNEWADVRLESMPKAAAPKSRLDPADHLSLVFDEADMVRLKLGEEAITAFHLLVALSTPGVAFSFDQLKTFPLQRESLLALLRERAGVGGQQPGAIAQQVTDNKDRQQALDTYCTNKTLLAQAGELDPVVGREKETRMMAEILSRRSKPNVLIVGEPGVGKSALIDGLALAIVAEQVPGFLRGAAIFELNTGSLLAGASYKGEVEDRLKSVVAAVKAHDKGILFIDELHVLLDKQGGAAGTANLLKPELARGALTVIGVTTLEEYRKHIEKDEAFARRFEVLTVAEPDNETAFRMLMAVIPGYAKHHQLQVEDSTLRETVRLARQYIKDKRLPDAAIDLADRAMAALRLAIDTGEQLLNDWKKQKENLPPDDIDAWKWHYHQLQQAVSPVLWAAAAPENNDLVNESDIERIRQTMAGIYQRWEEQVPFTRNSLLLQDVAAVVADKTGIPLGKLKAQEQERLLRMAEILKERVVGQDAAIASISEAILESRSGLSKPGQPIGSFFFAGPTGTGKTELAKALAEFLFQDEQYMIRFDMSEFKEEHAAAMLYGAPPGYVGYEEGGLLVNKIRRQPYAVVLFDEIEKAHPAVFDVFLQIMDEGKLHDKLGKTGDFSNAVIVFTSNIASQHIAKSISAGHFPGHTELLDIFRAHFRPEFLGRLTEIIPFAPMTTAMIENIFQIQVRQLHRLLEKQGIRLTVTEAAARELASRGYTPEYGARPLASVIRNELRRPLSRMIIDGTLKKNDEAILDVHTSNELLWKTKKD
ncbi:MAG: ATP-dependent Clp protease ATP-binding subunit [Flavihumibacter sp.]